MKRKTFSKILLLVLSLVVLATGCSQKSEGEGGNNAKEMQLSIGTASMGGAFYPIGQEISNLVTKYAEGVTMTPEVTGGAVENPRLVNDGDVELGITNANLGYFAYIGEEPYTKKLEVSGIASLHPSVFHIIAKDNSPINSIEDLKGKRIAVGPAGGGTLPILEAIFEEYGMSISDITANYLSYADGFSQLADDNVDVALALSGYPASAVMEISATRKIKFINVDQDKLDTITQKFPYYSGVNIPKDVYSLDEDATAVGVLNTLIVSSKLDEDTVYRITKAIFDNLDEFKEANAIAQQIDIDVAPNTAMPLHPGAQKYFHEIK